MGFENFEISQNDWAYNYMHIYAQLFCKIIKIFKNHIYAQSYWFCYQNHSFLTFLAPLGAPEEKLNISSYVFVFFDKFWRELDFL